MRTLTNMNHFNIFHLAHMRLFVVALIAALALPIVAREAGAAGGPAENLPAASKVETKTEYVFDNNLSPMLAPDSAERMRAIADRYRNIVAQGGFPKVPGGNYKKGSTGKGVVILNQRLYLDGYVRVEATQSEFASRFTSATEDGVRRFQRNMGLAVTGRVDQVTLAYLNVPADVRLRTILANINRLEVYEKDLGPRYVIVNIPAQQIETVENGRVYSHHNAIVGRPSRPSPVVMTPLEAINFNPYWNAPVSIVEADIFPKLRTGTRVLDDMNMKVFKGYGGPEIDPRSVNWRRAIPDDYHFRQEPGPGNAMATAKVTFKSPFGVYLHDTPEKPLFESKTRFYSSGCVRVQDMPGLVKWIVNGQDGIGETQISALAETLERLDVNLTAPPQLRQVYLTAWPIGNTVAFRYDIYDLDNSGFTVGQPMPLGEVAPDGSRFVLKPLPRLVQSIEDGNSAGFFLFGNRKTSGGSFLGGSNQGGTSMSRGKASDITRKLMLRLAKNSDDGPVMSSSWKSADEPSAGADDEDSTPPKKTLLGKSTTKPAKIKKNDDGVPGLFDWGKYRKEQAAKKGKKATDKKKVAKTGKADAKKVAATDSKDAAAAKKKPTDKATADKKKVDDKKSATKKPAACKPDKNGKLPDGCKTADAAPAKKPVEAVKKPAADKAKPETAAN